MARTQDEEFNLQQNNILKLEETLTVTLQSSLTASLQHWHSTLRSSHDVAGSTAIVLRAQRLSAQYDVTALRGRPHQHARQQATACSRSSPPTTSAPPARSVPDSSSPTPNAASKNETPLVQAFDHYYTKILKLRAEKETLTLKGKYTGKEVEKVTRNEQKFREAQAAYRTINRSVAGEMWLLWKKRWATMEELMGEVVKTEVMFVRALANQLDPMLVDVRKVTAESKAKVGGGEERDRDGREAPFFSAKPPVGLEEYEEEERRK